jgi:signal transduction histidine kinase/DNA-binding response OmpR family regulator
MSTFVKKNNRLFFRAFFFIFITLPVFAQKKATDFLSLKGQARLDSLELYCVSVLQEEDSSAAFGEVKSIKTYADKTQDDLLAVFADFLTGRYCTSGPLKDLKTQYNFLKNVQKKLSQQKSGPLKERLNADIEHALGNILYLLRSNSVALITHYLSADLIYRKIGYEHVLFSDRKLAQLGLYYVVEMSDYETAIRYFKEAEPYVQKDPIDRYRIAFYKDYANSLVGVKQYAQAIKYNKMGIAQVRLKRDSLRIGTISGNIGEIILNTYPNPAESEPYFQKELVYRLKYKPKGIEDIAKAYGNLCQVSGIKRNRGEVVRYFDKAITLLQTYKDTLDRHTILMHVYKNRFIADTLLGDYKNAYLHEKLYYEERMISQRYDLRVVTSEASVKFEAERNRLRAELANQQAKNSRFWVFVISLLLFIALIGGYFLYYRQRVKKEELARQLLFEQKEAERLAELNTLKTNFFANISHEFRTPLTLLVGPLANLYKKYPAESIIPLMQRNLSRLQTLINQLLDLSKLEDGKLQLQIQYGNLSRSLSYVFASFESLAQNKNIIFQRSQNHSDQLAYFDEDKLEKIVTNLLSNAFKFTPENGRVTATVEYSFPWVIITVSDNGIGIDPQWLPRIFDRFYQVDDGQRRPYEGTGIGLALVKELVSTLRGTIQVQSELRKGTTFVVKLPCDTAHWENFVMIDAKPLPKENGAQSFIEENTVISSPSSQQDLPILLIVEDNPDLRSYVRTIFEKSFRIEEAQDGQAGLEKVTQLIPDLVICDLMMPRLDGFGFCKALKTDMRTSHIPIIMLTAKATLEDRLEGLQLGADDYLTKPFHTEELQIRVQNLLRQRLILQQKYNRLPSEIQPQAPIQEAPMDEQFLRKTREILQSYLADSSLDVEKFALEMNMTAVQLRRKLKALTNQTVIEYVRNYRLEKAANLLKNKAGSVSEIAYQVGFESMPYFSKVFQDKFGKTPSEWG